MIKREDVYKIGVFNKPHGIHGELSFTFTDDIFDRVEAEYLICLLDGIFVPFFLEEYRFRSDSTALVEQPIWTKVTLPHCFNAEDAVDPDLNYYQGPGWYKTRLKLDNPYPDGRMVLEFEGAGQKTDRKSTRLNSSHPSRSRMPSSA